jgi:hypothetical protein
MTRWACEEAGEDAIDEVSIAGAVALITYFKSHAKLVYAYLQSTEGERRIDRVARWIRRHGRKTTPRDICTYKVGRCKTQQEAEGLLRTLVAEGYGFLSEEVPAGGGHIHKIFRIHDNV